MAELLPSGEKPSIGKSLTALLLMPGVQLDDPSEDSQQTEGQPSQDSQDLTVRLDALEQQLSALMQQLGVITI